MARKNPNRLASRLAFRGLGDCCGGYRGKGTPDRPSSDDAKAGRSVSEHSFAFDRLDMVRLRESPYYGPNLQVQEFMSALQGLLPLTGETNSEEN